MTTMYVIPLTIDDATKMAADENGHPFQRIEARGFIHGFTGRMLNDDPMNWQQWISYNDGWHAGWNAKHPRTIDDRLMQMKNLAEAANGIDLDDIKVPDTYPGWRDAERELEKVTVLVKNLRALATKP